MAGGVSSNSSPISLTGALRLGAVARPDFVTVLSASEVDHTLSSVAGIRPIIMSSCKFEPLGRSIRYHKFASHPQPKRRHPQQCPATWALVQEIPGHRHGARARCQASATRSSTVQCRGRTVCPQARRGQCGLGALYGEARISSSVSVNGSPAPFVDGLLVDSSGGMTWQCVI